MGSGGQTTLIQRVLERRSHKPPTSQDGTTATVAVMLRVVPPPKALLMCQDVMLQRQLERCITADMLDCESAADEHEALRRLSAEFCPVVVTDSLPLLRRLRALSLERAPFVVYLAEHDDPETRESGLAAGA